MYSLYRKIKATEMRKLEIIKTSYINRSTKKLFLKAWFCIARRGTGLFCYLHTNRLTGHAAMYILCRKIEARQI